MKIANKESIEMEYWKQSADEALASDRIDNVIGKFGDAAVFLDCLKKYEAAARSARRVLELGAGQGWASCVLKKQFPAARVICTDISPHALDALPKWEKFFGVTVDEKTACKSYEIPAEASSLDLVFCFQSAHHFVAHRETLRDVHRVLKPGGTCLFLYEPSCRAFLHPLAKWRVNRKRPDVPEDVLVFEKMAAHAREAGLACTLDFFPSTLKRQPVEAVYYGLLNQLPFLQQILPCTVNYRFVKDR